jgi:hypothetical protein
MQAAGIGGNAAVIKWLIQRGANTHTKGGRLGSVLTGSILNSEPTQLTIY